MCTPALQGVEGRCGTGEVLLGDGLGRATGLCQQLVVGVTIIDFLFAKTRKKHQCNKMPITPGRVGPRPIFCAPPPPRPAPRLTRTMPSSEQHEVFCLCSF